uniref:U3 small nucleolar RNA-associated protein 25 homolog n=1 Tax=Capitella teleta TaxID=283909 RepID=X1YWV6_CAPTE
MTAFQLQLFTMLNQYNDVYYPERSASNAESIRFVYTLHALNHILKTRDNVINHNNQIKSKRQDIPDEFRDQGLTRPKVLIILPFRSAVLRVVKILSKLIFQNDKANVLHMKKFLREFGVEDDDEMKNKPEDHRQLFAGNTDDNFLLGLSLGKRSLKLYTKLYSSDILLASPLALRLRVGADGDEERDYDFLSSIEVLIMDQVDVFEMQNWDHVLHVLNQLHLQPKEAHAVNFSRVRMWTLNGWYVSKFYRQTLMFSSLVSPEINSIFSKHCSNILCDFLVMKSPSTGSICQIVAQLPQVFHRIECSSLASADEARFEFFKKKILPKVHDDVMSNTFIFVSSYFDFVRLRNYLRKEELDFNYISEYCKHSQVSRARTLFHQNRVHTMLYTERFHFFNRLLMRGIRHLIFYQLPAYAHFYSEVCNMLDSSRKNSEAASFTCAVLYTKYDALRLAAVVGHERASHMLHATKGVHLFVTGDETQQ